MRYEGRQRRSQVLAPTPWERVWGWFSSVRVAIGLLVGLTLLVALGSVYEREVFVAAVDKEAYYTDKYGWMGYCFYHLGLTDLYSTWWFTAWLAALGISLVVCSLDRFLPLRRAFQQQTVKKSESFLRWQMFFHQEPIVGTAEARLSEIAAGLRKLRYRVRVVEGALLAEKGRWSRWGPYINHVGLVLFLLGLALRLLPGWYLDLPISVPENRTVAIPGTAYAVKNQQYSERYYEKTDRPIAQEFKTDLALYQVDSSTSQPQELLAQGSVRVNEPFAYRELELFQSDRERIFRTLSLRIRDKLTQQDLGRVTLDLPRLKIGDSYPLAAGRQLFLRKYYPEMAIRQGEITTLSDLPRWPAFELEIVDAQQQPGTGERLLYVFGWGSGPLNHSPDGERYTAHIDPQIGFTLGWISVLTARVDRALPIFFCGGLVCILGLFLGFYWQHRRIWLLIKGESLFIGAHTNKYSGGLRQDLERLPLPTAPWREQRR